MTETRALDEPLSDAELDELEGFLASDAVPEDCMDLEMLDGFLAAIVSGPESIQPSEWLPQVWSDGGRTATPAYGNSGDAQRIRAAMAQLEAATRRGSRCTTPRTRATGSFRSRRLRSATRIPSSPSGSTTRKSARAWSRSSPSHQC